MCRICDSANRVRDAAEELATACVASVTLRKTWNLTLQEPVPPEITDLLRRLK